MTFKTFGYCCFNLVKVIIGTKNVKTFVLKIPHTSAKQKRKQMF